MQEVSKRKLNKPRIVGRLPRFPYGGTNRIRFKGYNLSRMAPPSKMLIKLSGLFPTKSAANLQQFCELATPQNKK